MMNEYAEMALGKKEFLEHRGYHTGEMYAWAWAERVAEAERETKREMHLLEELQEQCSERVHLQLARRRPVHPPSTGGMGDVAVRGVG